MELKCEKCGKVATFNSEKEAFNAGWDFKPMCPVTTCSECPSAPLLFPAEDNDKRKDEHE